MTDQRTSEPPRAPFEDRPPWALTAEEVVERLSASVERGLTAAEAARRLALHGPNRLLEAPPRSGWRILADQFASPIAALLAAAAVLAFALDDPIEGGAIVAVLLLNAAIGFTTERRAVRSMEALRALGQAEATVRRDGRLERVPASDLVPGDLVVFEAGDVLVADMRLVAASRLEVDESPLTGESLPQAKDTAPVPAAAGVDERTGVVFKGTAVTRGSGEAVVHATGMATELGRISSLVASAEPSRTPFERRLQRLARRLIGLTLVVAALVAIAMLTGGRGVELAIETAVALAVATIPEGLPIVATVALARGMWRMVRHHALVENLAAVETLGSTTLVLTDKTGTLTENRMTVVEYRLACGTVAVSGAGLELAGEFALDGEVVEPASVPELELALRVGGLCTNAELGRDEQGATTAVGDPTEVALVIAATKAGLDRAGLVEAAPEVGEVAFDSSAKRMATLHAQEDGVLVAVKGAPEAVLDACARLVTGADEAPLSDAARAEWSTAADALGARGRRVLGLAVGRRPAGTTAADFEYEDLALVGLVGLFDPPRASARLAVEACHRAGIRVVMVTGDHGETGWSVGAAVGLVGPDDDRGRLVDARGLASLADLSEDEARRLLDAAVVARAAPRSKLDLIELHQREGAVVAMTGDGVNDAPALEKADVGVAMGVRGTQVARDAADVVLLDDELGTIVTAVAQGRAIFQNVRTFVVYLLSCNVSEILVVGAGALVPGPLPILPLQILFLNLVTDVFPALALGVCEGSPALIERPPRDPKEPILTRAHWRRVFALGAVLAAAVLSAYTGAGVLFGGDDPRTTSTAFVALALAQLWLVLAMRDRASHWAVNEVTRNRWVWGALALCLALVVLAVEWEPLAAVLAVAPPGPRGWLLAIGASAAPLVLVELYRAVIGRRRRG